MRLKVWLCAIMLIHLQATAGELIKMKGLGSRQPEISVPLTKNEVAALEGAGLETGGLYLSVYLVRNDTPASVPVAGRYTLDDGVLSFKPLYPLGYQLEFEAQYKSDGKITATMRFITPGHPLSDKTAEVEAVYPLADTIPYNILFFNIRFSHAMSGNEEAYKYIKVFDDAGAERTNAWRQRSFWLDSGRVLVLMIHPGRVKNGIHYESPLFDSGRLYTLKVNAEIQDVNGNPIKEIYERSFYIRGEDRKCPKVNVENIMPPVSGSRSPLLFSFSEGMDYASVIDGARVFNERGEAVRCTVREVRGDHHYAITPHAPWQKGKYTLSLKGTVYDHAANRINRLFEVTDATEFEKDNKETEIPFEVK